MKQIQAKIAGLSALLMNRFGEDEQAKVAAGGGPVTAIPEREADAEKRAYRMAAENGKKGNLYVPAECLRQALVNAAVYEKGKGRASLAKFAAAAIFIMPDALDLGVSEYIIDSRPVVIKATKGRVVRHRPRLDEWALGFTIDYDETLLTGEQVRRVVDHCGAKVGLLDFRPQCRGPFGRFRVDSWEV